MMFLDCPAYVDRDGTLRCGLPAEVRCRFTMRSTDGPLEAAMIRCPAGHWFTGAIGALTWNSEHKHDPGTAAVPSTARHGSLPRTHDVRDSTGGVTRHEFPAGQGQAARRPNCAPAYYQGWPAQRWITAMRRHPTAGSRPMPAITGGEGAPPLGGGLTSAQAETIRATPAPTSWPRGTVSPDSSIGLVIPNSSTRTTN